MTVRHGVRKYLLGLCAVLGLSTAGAADLQEGQSAPAFSLIDQNGKTQSLADYQGRWVVLYFYPKDDTPGCTKEACDFRDDIAHISARCANSRRESRQRGKPCTLCRKTRPAVSAPRRQRRGRDEILWRVRHTGAAALRTPTDLHHRSHRPYRQNLSQSRSGQSQRRRDCRSQGTAGRSFLITRQGETRKKMTTVIVWFRNDLRVADNPALHHALAAGAQVIPLYIHAPDEQAPWPPSAASRWWLHHSLIALNETIVRLGSRLIVRRGPTLATLHSLIRQTDASQLYCSRTYEPVTDCRDRDILRELAAAGVRCTQYNASLLHEPGSVLNKDGHPYKVFTPFWRACQRHADATMPLSSPSAMPLA